MFGTLNPESLICHGFPAVPTESAEKFILLILATSLVSKACVICIGSLLNRDRPLSLSHGEELVLPDNFPKNVYPLVPH